MNPAAIQNQPLLEWGVAERPIAGESVSGDLHMIKFFDRGVLLAVIDGVGHGDEATVAAKAAVAVLNARPHESIISLLQRCHASLAQTRGVVMTLAAISKSESTLTWLGVGNVEGRLLRADPAASHPRESVLLRGGIVGYQLPALHASVLPLATGDLLVFATDGIDAGFTEELNRNDPPQQIAERILSGHFKGNDDALVLVARYVGNRYE